MEPSKRRATFAESQLDVALKDVVFEEFYVKGNIFDVIETINEAFDQNYGFNYIITPIVVGSNSDKNEIISKTFVINMQKATLEDVINQMSLTLKVVYTHQPKFNELFFKSFKSMDSAVIPRPTRTDVVLFRSGPPQFMPDYYSNFQMVESYWDEPLRCYVESVAKAKRSSERLP